MKNCVFAAFLLIAAFFASFILMNFPVQAAPELEVSFYKDNGYGLGNDISGLWTINTDVSSNTTHVEFYLDDLLQLNDTSSPFSWQFDTSNYGLGLHTIEVVAYDGVEPYIFERQSNFVEFPMTFTISLIAVVVVVIIVVFVIAIIMARRKEAKERAAKYS